MPNSGSPFFIFKPITWLSLAILLLSLSCSQNKKTEKEEIAFWKQSLVDSSYRLLYKYKDTTRALRYFDSLFRQTEGETVYPNATRFDLLANYHYFFTGDNYATAAMIDSALAVYNTEKLQSHYAHTYVGLLLFGGHIAYRLTQYGKANEYYFRAKELGDTYLSPCERAAFNYNIAMVLYRQQNFPASLNYFKQAYSLQQTCAPQTTAVVLQQQEIQSNIALCFIELKGYDSAMVHLDKALQIADRYKDSLGASTMEKIYGVVYGEKAKILMEKGRLEEAKTLCLKSIALNDREDYELENALGVKLQLATINYREKNLASMGALLQSVKTQIQSVAPQHQLEWKRLMAAYYEEVSQPHFAMPYLKDYFSLSDSLGRKQKELTAADITRKLRDKEQQLKIIGLQREKDSAQALLLMTIIFSCMAIAIIYLVYQNYRRGKKNIARLQILNEEIKAQKAAREEEAKQQHKLITEAVIRAQENERSLIGLELHDNINQVLTTVKLQNEMVLEGAVDPKLMLPRTLKYLQDCISEIRGLSKRLSAPTLGKISLEESVKDLIDSINATSKVKITHHFSGLNNEGLKKELHIGVYRILQEQLNNVLKHAEASEVYVSLERSADSIYLTVTDNGKGFVVQNNKNGIGLVNMQTRAESLNGTFQLESQPGEGCEMKLVLPCMN